VDNGVVDGVRYIHRMPCSAEQREIIRGHIRHANTVRLIWSAYEIGEYLWDRMPFKKEARLLYSLISRAYVGVRSMIRFWLRR
jgi:hypothetical protein